MISRAFSGKKERKKRLFLNLWKLMRFNRGVCNAREKNHIKNDVRIIFMIGSFSIAFGDTNIKQHISRTKTHFERKKKHKKSYNGHFHGSKMVFTSPIPFLCHLHSFRYWNGNLTFCSHRGDTISIRWKRKGKKIKKTRGKA